MVTSSVAVGDKVGILTILGFNSLRPSDVYVSVNKVIIGTDNGLSPDRRQSIIWTNGGILFIGTMGINFCEMPI